MDYDPRAATGIPTEPVGSIPRPLKLQQAYADYDAKKIPKEQLEQEQNAAVVDTLERFEATGSPIISDGEQRVSSFATYPIADTLAGSGLAPHLAPGGQYFAIFADGHNRQLPKVTGGPFHYNFYAGELVKKAVKMTNRPLHQAVIAPSMMYLLYPLDGDLPGIRANSLRRISSTSVRKTFVPVSTPAPHMWSWTLPKGDWRPATTHETLGPRVISCRTSSSSTIASSIAFRRRSARK